MLDIFKKIIGDIGEKKEWNAMEARLKRCRMIIWLSITKLNGISGTVQGLLTHQWTYSKVCLNSSRKVPQTANPH